MRVARRQVERGDHPTDRCRVDGAVHDRRCAGSSAFELCAPLDLRAGDLPAMPCGAQIVSGQLPGARGFTSRECEADSRLDRGHSDRACEGDERAPVEAPIAAPVHIQHWVVHDQRTVKTPFIPASACPGTVQR